MLCSGLEAVERYNALARRPGMRGNRGRVPARAPGGGAEFSPLDLADLEAWYRADLLVTTSGTDVTAWGDSAGDVSKDLAAPGGFEPALNAADAAFNGQATISFGGGDLLRSGAWGAALAQPVTLYVVGIANNTAGTKYFTDGNAARMILHADAAEAPLFYAGSAAITGTRVLTTKFVACCVGNGASSALYVDDSDTAEATGDPGNNGLDALSLGDNYAGGAAQLTGKIAEVIICSTAHSAGQRLQVMQYLGTRYDIAVS